MKHCFYCGYAEGNNGIWDVVLQDYDGEKYICKHCCDYLRDRFDRERTQRIRTLLHPCKCGCPRNQHLNLRGGACRSFGGGNSCTCLQYEEAWIIA